MYKSHPSMNFNMNNLVIGEYTYFPITILFILKFILLSIGTCTSNITILHLEYSKGIEKLKPEPFIFIFCLSL